MGTYTSIELIFILIGNLLKSAIFIAAMFSEDAFNIRAYIQIFGLLDWLV